MMWRQRVKLCVWFWQVVQAEESSDEESSDEEEAPQVVVANGKSKNVRSCSCFLMAIRCIS